MAKSTHVHGMTHAYPNMMVTHAIE